MTIKHALLINRPPEQVWDYTQDYSRRHEWDAAVVRAEVLSTHPHRVVRVYMTGNTEMTFDYKQDERPRATSLVARDIASPVIASAGGHWTYEARGDATLWSVTNTIELHPRPLMRMFMPILRYLFTRQTRKAMLKAKRIIERE